MPGLREKTARLVVVLLSLLAAPHTGHSKALSFNSKTLESSSQLWSGFRHVLSPSFEDTNQNVTALIGDSAFLPCTVAHLGDRSVTWMRKRDLHILTAGIYTYSADERFRVLHPENSNDWTLHIKFATLRDSGLYECQVNSDPKISRPILLNVIEGQLDDPAPYETPAADIRFPDYKFEPSMRQTKKSRRKHKNHQGRARGRKVASVSIEGTAERHIQIGSVLAITCVVRHPVHEAPEHILWFHGPTNVDYDSARGGVSIQTEKAARQTVSKLMLSAVSEADTGEYTCSPTSLQPALVTVHVQDNHLAPTTSPRLPCPENLAPSTSFRPSRPDHLSPSILAPTTSPRPPRPDNLIPTTSPQLPRPNHLAPTRLPQP